MGNSACKNRVALDEDFSKVLQVVKLDGKVIEFDAPIRVKDLLAAYPNLYVGAFREATQPLPLDCKLKVGGIYYLLPYFADRPCKDDEQIDDAPAKRVKMVITKQQLQLLLSKDIRIEDFFLELDKGSCRSLDDAARSWRPTLQAIPEGRISS
ncbi:hypothetical protein Droror1_Dr00022657 [Drosera rotundifolia]